MNVLVLGGTGLVGAAVTEALDSAGAQVSVLCRSEQSCERADSLHATPVRGDISNPTQWINAIESLDSVIHCACTFGDDMPTIDERLLDAMFDHARHSNTRKTLIYTGGTWLYPDSAGDPIDERIPYCPVAGFEWMVDGIQRIRNNPDIRGLIIHPAIVVDDPDGIPDILKQDFAATGELNIPFSNQLLWPIVHRLELAEAYVRVLDNGADGETYNAASIDAARVECLVRQLGKRHNITDSPRVRTSDYWLERHGDMGGYPLSQCLCSNKLRALQWDPGVLTRSMAIT